MTATFTANTSTASTSTDNTGTDKPRLAVLISGSGSNLQSIIDATKNGELAAEICLVVSNRPEAYGLTRASNAGIATECIDHKAFASREQFDQALATCVANAKPDLVILAGFMRILSAEFVGKFTGKLMNIHPSLLPKYPGLNTHQRALDARDEHAGATVHFVTEELDGGPPVIQARVPVHSGDDADSLAARVLVKEHKIYVEAIKWFVNGRLQLASGAAQLDGETLPAQGHNYVE